MYFDSHAHYNDERYDEDRHQLLKRLNSECSVDYIMNISYDMPSSEQTVILADKYDFVYGAVGTHPHDSKDMKASDYDILREYTKNEKIVAIGETGLDYHYDLSPRDIQKKVFSEHLDLAKELKLPVVIHEREATKDVLDIVNAHDNYGVFHCFAGSKETAKIVLDKGYMIAFGGTVTFKNSRFAKENAAYVPKDMFLIETDCPYLTPEPFRGRRNSSEYLSYVCQTIADIRGITPEKVAELSMANAKRLFGIK